jgi:exodeoxyribonuclease III
MPRLTLATWNINSVRLRIDLVGRLLADHAPDVLCLQETKCQDGQFPTAAFEKWGYRHIALHGQKGWHGVAIVSRLPIETVERRRFCGKDDARHVATTLEVGGSPLTIDSLYVPAGGDEPDPDINPKFAHKLAFLDEMRAWVGESPVAGRRLLVGDLNIAPYEDDVWSHRQLLDVVSHTPIETDTFEAIRLGGGWIDAMRQFVPLPQKLFTWWSYRAQDWTRADRGRRLDHIWASPALDGALTGIEVVRDARGWQKPSDHVPVIARLEL